MSNEEDGAWLEALAGRESRDPTQSGEPAPASVEGRHLREMMLRNRSVAQIEVSSPDPKREEALIARARREGLIDLDQLARFARQRRLRVAYISLGLAAVVAGVAVLPGLLFRKESPAQVVRGGGEASITMKAADPRALKFQILRELKDAGLTATGYERFGIEGIDADLPQPVPEAVRAVLQRHHIEIPRGDELRIEIAPLSSPGAGPSER